ncbi:MAG: hypothetical protein SGBAC_002848 [Bacillariaceae sp.]
MEIPLLSNPILFRNVFDEPPTSFDQLDLLVLPSCQDEAGFRETESNFYGQSNYLPTYNLKRKRMSESHGPDGSASDMNGPGDDHSSTLDHALLESLFYNEMMMLSASSPSSSTMMAQQLHEATSATSATSRELPIPPMGDATTLVEKEMLQDFGVTASPVMLQSPPGGKVPVFTTPVAAVSVHGAPVHSQAPVSDQVSSSLKAPYLSHNVTSQLEPLHPSAASAATQPLQQNPSHAFLPTPALSSEPPVSQERAKQLVNQFATLASRLGIELPNQILQQLTTATKGFHDSDQIVGAQSGAAEAQNGRPIVPRGDAIDSLRLTAEEAIATVTKKRSPGGRQESPTNASANANGNKPLYSKRRKKPRLSDCESKLAQLKAENEVLKRHLQNVSNKAHQIEHGKEESALRIKQLHESGALPNEMENVVKDMTDTYSDYGVNRQQELSFHLEQLSSAYAFEAVSPNSRRDFVASLATAAVGFALSPNPASAVEVGGKMKLGDESIMSQKGHGTSANPVQSDLLYGVSEKLADKISNYNRQFAEFAGYFRSTSFEDVVLESKGPVTFYDSVTGKPLFVAPINRSAEDFIQESEVHGWPSFRDEEVVWDNVRILKNSGETVSVDGTHLGHNVSICRRLLPDRKGNRYCINLVSVAGKPL